MITLICMCIYIIGYFTTFLIFREESVVERLEMSFFMAINFNWSCYCHGSIPQNIV